jgi:hypothetical protein
MRDFCFPLEDPNALKAVDLVFADSIAHARVKHSKLLEYRLIAPSSLEYVRTAMKSYEIRVRLSKPGSTRANGKRHRLLA